MKRSREINVTRNTDALTADECYESRDLTRDTRAPLLRPPLPEVRRANVDVHASQYQHVDSNAEIRHGQVGDESRLNFLHGCVGSFRIRV